MTSEFTSLEIAHFLAQDDPKGKNRRIWVMKKNTMNLMQLSQQDFETFFGVIYRNHPHFHNLDSFQKTVLNCPWTLKTSFLGEENRQQALKYRKELAKGWIANVSIRWVNQDIGYGLFANEHFPPGAFIGEFTGLIRRLYRLHPDPNEYCFHYPTRWWSWNYTVIDALREGNEMRFINHSDQPNLQPLCLCDRGLLHIVFVTKTSIHAGTQLTYDYGKDFWKHRQKIKSHRHR